VLKSGERYPNFGKQTGKYSTQRLIPHQNMELDQFGRRVHRPDSDKPTDRWGPRHESTVVNESCRVFIGNLSRGTTTQDLHDHLRAAGFNAKFVNIFQDHGQSKGCGLVHFQSIQEAKNAIQAFNSTMFMGRLIIMRFDGEAGGIKVGNNAEKTMTKPPTQQPIINNQSQIDVLTSELDKLNVNNCSPDVVIAGVYKEITLIEGLTRKSAKSIRMACYTAQSTSWTELNDGTEVKRCIVEETDPDDGSMTITTTTTTYKETDALPRGSQVAEDTTTETRIVPAPSVSSSSLQSSSNSCTRPWLQILEKAGLHYRLVADNFNSSSIRHCKVKVRKQGDNKYAIVFEYSAEGQQFPSYQMSKLKAVFQKHTCAGFLNWLSGATGWKYDITDGTKWKTCVVAKLNSLQGVHSIFAKDRTQKYFFGKSGRMTWRRQSELTDVVSDIRQWIEFLSQVRETQLTRQLLRNSSSGPDNLVHWAYHHPQ